MPASYVELVFVRKIIQRSREEYTDKTNKWSWPFPLYNKEQRKKGKIYFSFFFLLFRCRGKDQLHLFISFFLLYAIILNL